MKNGKLGILIRFLIFLFLTNSLVSQEYKSENVQKWKSKTESFESSLEVYKSKKNIKKNHKELYEFLTDALVSNRRGENTDKEFEDLLHNLFLIWRTLSEELKIRILEIVHGLWDKEFIYDIERIYPELKDERMIAIAFLYLNKHTGISEFSYNKKNRVLHELSSYISKKNQPTEKNLTSIFLHASEYEGWKFFNIQRKNRTHSGIIIVMDESGNFVKDSSGKIFNKKILSRSITNLPYFVINGNTPSGVYALIGKNTSSNPLIGPVPVIKFGLPYEYSIQKFQATREYKDWSLSFYKSLFPKSWHEYPEITESLQAGKLGRSGIWIHGSTIDPMNFSSDKPIPALGCSTLLETWSTDGGLSSSDQWELTQILGDEKLEVMKGLLYVIELNDEDSSVELEDIQDEIDEYIFLIKDE
ncbi:MAG: hypothetical protein SFU98_18055 [Leptospiraceae bacterium]|nr:hypothetical protein [Leptospiraceae bacterium]